LLFKDSVLHFEGNKVSGSGAAIYVVYPTINYVLPILNRGCFIQYHSEDAADLPPNQWVWLVNDVNDNCLWPIESVLLECLVIHCLSRYLLQLYTPIMKQPMCFTLYINAMTCEMCDNRKLQLNLSIIKLILVDLLYLLLTFTTVIGLGMLSLILLLLFLTQMTQPIVHLS